jgi:hypothetical protein
MIYILSPAPSSVIAFSVLSPRPHPIDQNRNLLPTPSTPLGAVAGVIDRRTSLSATPPTVATRAGRDGFPRIRATVAPAPYDAHARTQYRRH